MFKIITVSFNFFQKVEENDGSVEKNKISFTISTPLIMKTIYANSEN